MKAALVTGALVGMLLAGCSSPKVAQPVADTALHDLAGSALASYEQGGIDRASQLFERALERARLIGDLRETARNAYNLALCRLAQGRTAEAHALLAQARAGLPPQGAEAARVWLAEMQAALHDGLPQEVRADAQRALDAGADPAGRAEARLELADMAYGSNDVVSARRLLAEVGSDLGLAGPPALQARAAGIEAQLAEHEGSAAAAAAAQEREADYWGQAGRYQWMSMALAGAGASYRSAGLPRKAYPCLLRAGASFKAAGDRKHAQDMVTAAVTTAREAGEKDWVTAAEALLAEIGKP